MMSCVPYAPAAADFDDKFLSPLAQFYRPQEIEPQIEAEALACLDSGTHRAGMMLRFLIQKCQPSLAEPHETPDIRRAPNGTSRWVVPAARR